MGILFLPLLVGALWIYIYSFNNLIKAKKIIFKQTFIGGLLSIILCALLVYFLTYDGRTYVFGPFFLLTTGMIIIPGLFLYSIKNKQGTDLYNILLTNILISGILVILNFIIVFDYLEKMNYIIYYH